MSEETQKWKSLVRSILQFEKDPTLLRLDSLGWSDNSQWSRSAYHLLMGIIRNRTLLKHLLNQFVSKKPKPLLQAFLLLGVYQLLESRNTEDRLPKIVHHTVGLINKNCSPREGKFANAVLRKTAESINSQLETLKITQNWTVLYSHPEWLVKRWIHIFGETETLKILEWNQQKPHLYIHDYSGFLKDPRQEGLIDTLHLKPSQWPDFYQMDQTHHKTINQLLTYPFYIQDPSTSIAPALLGNPLSGNILDACAAPGGKTLILNKLLGSEKGDIFAVDHETSRIRMIEENRQRLNLTRVKVLCWDWETQGTHPDMPDLFDYALVDAPCSGAGIIRKHPEIRWRLKPDDYELLPALQLRILKAVASKVTPGGKLVYSTCSIDPAENTEVVQSFIQSEEGKGFKILEEKYALPHASDHDGIGAVLLENEL